MNEEEVRAALENLCQRLKITGYVFLFMDSGRVKVIGEMSFSDIVPLILGLKK